MDYKISQYPRNIPDKVLLADLRKTAKKLRKKKVSMADYNKYGKYHPSTIAKRFSTWNEALIKACLKINQIKPITDEDLLTNLKMVWDTLGRQPSCTQMHKPLSKFHRNAYKRRFGSWFGALKAFAKAVKAGKIKGGKKLSCKKQAPRDRGRGACVSKSMRYDVFKRDHFKCKLCGRSPATDPTVILHVDHKIPVSKGGKTVMENLETLCNLGKGDKCDETSPPAPLHIKRGAPSTRGGEK